MNRLLLFALAIALTVSLFSCDGISQKAENDPLKNLKLHINHSVNNADREEESKLIEYWQSYLNSSKWFTRDTMWYSEEARYPTVFLFETGLTYLESRKIPLHNTVLGLVPVEDDYWMMKSLFYSIDSTSSFTNINHIVSVYFKFREDGSIIMQNSTDYHRSIWQSAQVGSIRYYMHPDFHFIKEDAIKMSDFNDSLAVLYDVPPLKFDYFVSRYTREIAQLMGYDFNPNIYRPEQSGGMADIYNGIIYAGNNSAYYPHEVVHLYNYEVAGQGFHQIFDEGVATFFGGSGGYDLDWHLVRLKEFIQDDLDFDFSDLNALATDIPNDELLTDFRYVIGGFLTRKIYNKEGMVGLREALTAGRSDDDFFRVIKEKLGVSKKEFNNYIRKEVTSG